MRCWHCKRELEWKSDLDAVDFDEDMNTYVPIIVTFLHCKHCPCDVEVRMKMPPCVESDDENPFTAEIPEQDPNAAITEDDLGEE